jgi:hypothetical protein
MDGVASRAVMDEPEVQETDEKPAPAKKTAAKKATGAKPKA